MRGAYLRCGSYPDGLHTQGDNRPPAPRVTTQPPNLAPHDFLILMALRSTVFKANLQISDMDRAYYAHHALTMARHPSETDERMMVRLIAFARHAHEHLTFARGLSEDEEPDLWQKDLTGAIVHWIDVGQPDEKRILKASGRSEQVTLYSYGGHGTTLWWNNLPSRVVRLKNLTVFQIAETSSHALAELVQRSMDLSCVIEDGQLWLSDPNTTVVVECSLLQAS